MKISVVLLLPVLCLALTEAHGQTTPAARITIDVADPGRAFSPTMYGVFFEDINHAADGGLYAELIQNRDFEYNRAPEDMHWINDSTVVNPKGWKEIYRRPGDLHAWTVVQERGATARISLETKYPMNPANAQSLRLDVGDPGSGRAGVANEGYWGVPVRKGATYQLSFYARKDPRSTGVVSVWLESASGVQYAMQQISGLTATWKQFRATLTSNADDPVARFVLSTQSAGTIWLDMVSLFPKDTWKDRPNGLRKDLAGMLEGLRPSFFRFPGGCVVEGATLENRVQWKRTIGDVAGRPGHWNLWGFRATDGLGFHEFLQLCEDLGAAPLYVVNEGMSCQGRGGMVAPKEELTTYLQDALDALEYAMGPVTSRWGAVRAANGHSAPFPISYVEVGNENNGPDYRAAYKFIQSGIKRKYPRITTIANYDDIAITEQDRKQYPGLSVEMFDEHYYQAPAFFFDQSTRYDSYKRSDSVGIYVGEFAVTLDHPGQGNLRAAIGEAAFMVGFERNADLVRMASYAPTFVNVHDRRWNPNMIVYNTSQVYGTPSYHAFKMFSENRPDRVVPTSVALAADTNDLRWKHLRGGIAVGTWSTKAEFKDIRVEREGQVLFADDLTGGTSHWTQVQDRWDVSGGALTNGNTVMNGIAGAGDSTWTDYTLSLKARKVSGEEGFIFYVLRNGDNQCLWNIGGWSNAVDVLAQERHGSRVDLGSWRALRVETGIWYDIRIEIRGARIQCYLNGELRHDEALREQYVRSIYATAGVRERERVVIAKVVNPFAEAKRCRVVLNGASGVQPEGEAFVLTSGSPDDENSFAEPERVAAQKVALRDVGQTFDYTCPPHSLSVLRLNLKR